MDAVTQRARDRFFKYAHGHGWAVLGKWVSATDEILLRCPAGHEAPFNPQWFRAARGQCSRCGDGSDRLYLIAHPGLPYLKVGIATGEKRVKVHQGRGWSPVCVIKDLSPGVARTVEQAVLRAVRQYGFEHLKPEQVPARDGSRETFHIGALGIALDVMEAHGLAIPPHLRQLAA